MSNELGKLTGKGNLRGLGDVEERYLVKHLREPLRLLFPVHAQTPQGVVERFVTQGYLRDECFFLQVLNSTGEFKILIELIFPVDTAHRLALHTILCVVFE